MPGIMGNQSSFYRVYMFSMHHGRGGSVDLNPFGGLGGGFGAEIIRELIQSEVCDDWITKSQLVATSGNKACVACNSKVIVQVNILDISPFKLLNIQIFNWNQLTQPLIWWQLLTLLKYWCQMIFILNFTSWSSNLRTLLALMII